MRQTIGIFIFVASMVAVPGMVRAVGMAVKPERLTLDTVIGRTITAPLLVINVTDEPALYRVYPASHVNTISVSPNEFLLLPGEQKTVSVTVQTFMPKAISTDIAVVARPLAATNIATASGIKIPLYVMVRVALWHVGVVTAIVGCALVMISVRWKKKSNNQTTV